MRNVCAATAAIVAVGLVLACSSSSPPPSCEGAACGDDRTVYVAPDGLDTQPGTREAPVATVRGALRLAAYARRARVVLAEGKYTEGAPVVWVDGVTLEGGFARATWEPGGGPSEVAGAPIALVATRLSQGGSLSNVVVRAQGSPSPEVPSVALWVSDLAEGASFRVGGGAKLLAGAGGDGAPGAPGRSAGSLDGPPGRDGKAGSVDGEIEPGEGGEGGRTAACPA
ncbi:MAG TPA: hypothetical protein PLR99_20605, partial [Polyangiaceae bacterium]|nr:hypothetical protein [Polyangiaceae bacterium]